MSKRKAATASKHIRSPVIAAKAQRASQAIVRSPKENRLRSVAAGSTDASVKRDREMASLVQSPATALSDDFKNNGPKKGFDFSSPTANVRAYQAKLLEMAQGNMQFALESAQRLATIRSPVEFIRFIEELTSKRIALFQKHSIEWLN